MKKRKQKILTGRNCRAISWSFFFLHSSPLLPLRSIFNNIVPINFESQIFIPRRQMAHKNYDWTRTCGACWFIDITFLALCFSIAFVPERCLRLRWMERRKIEKTMMIYILTGCWCWNIPKWNRKQLIASTITFERVLIWYFIRRVEQRRTWHCHKINLV